LPLVNAGDNFPPLVAVQSCRTDSH